MLALIIVPASLYVCSCVAARPRVAARMWSRCRQPIVSGDAAAILIFSWVFMLVWPVYLSRTSPSKIPPREKRERRLRAWQKRYETNYQIQDELGSE